MAEVIELFDDDWWIDRAFEAMRRRRDRRVTLIVIALLCRFRVVEGGVDET